jgi:quinol monooxygenase YgiN
MLLVNARCNLLPERQTDFIREVQKIIPVVRREAGCTRYELLSDVCHPGIFHFIEEWESQRHLDDHLTSDPMQEYFSKTAQWHSAPTELKTYEIRSSQSVTM